MTKTALASFAALLLAFLGAGKLSATPTFVQSAYAAPASGPVTVAYQKAEGNADLNVVVVGWHGSGTVNSISDSNNNVYNLAVGPTSAGNNNQSIYYAAGVKPGADSITVTFSGTVTNPDVRILEYSGVNNANPVDTTAIGWGATPNNGDLPGFTTAVNTTFAPDLLVAANTVSGHNTGAGLGFTQRMITRPGYNLAEDRIVTVPGLYSGYSDKLVGSSPFVMQMVAFRGAVAQGADNTAPTVSLTPPSSGTGTITVTVNASDNPGGTGVSSVLLYIDSVPYGTSAIAPPYTFSVDTTKFNNGSHTLTALAYDAAGNNAFANPISVTFSNSAPANPAVSGVVSNLISMPGVSINLALLPDGNVLENEGEAFGWFGYVWNPIFNVLYFEPTPVQTNIFCSGEEQLGDGRVMIAGGQLGDVNGKGIQANTIFDPTTYTWFQGASMHFPRWYPSACILQDGRVIVTNGEQSGKNTNAVIPEVYTPSTNSWHALTNARFPYNEYYPLTFLLPDGRVFAAGTEQFSILSQVVDLTVNSPTWTTVGGSTVFDGGSAVSYLPGHILKMGHYGDAGAAQTPSTNTAYTIDMTAPNPLWTAVGSMQYPRTYHTPTLLPDGTVLVTGGGTDSTPGDVANAVLPIELWSPTTGNWTTLASLNSPRLYHSEGLLLPDGRVLISGGGRYTDNTLSTFQFSCEFFAPPYLFKGPRPRIDSAPKGKITYGSTFSVTSPDAGSISAVNLVRYGSVTHGFNMSQYFIPLSFTANGNTLTVTAPASGTIAPPGNYLLFILNSAGVPSIAATVRF